MIPARLRIHEKVPRVDVVTRSYAMLVRDGAIKRLKEIRYFGDGNFTFRRSRAFQLQPDQLPYCCVYLTEENLLPDGDANAGEPRARSLVNLNHSIVIANNDEDRAEDRLDDAYQAIMNGLLTDPTFFNNDEFSIQSFVRGKRTFSYGNAGRADNETPYAEMKLELSFDLGTLTWEPDVRDMLETIHVEVQHPPGDDENVHVVTQYDLDQ